MNRNVLKIIAFVAMVIDHIGTVLFPDYVIFKIIGRIAFPIFSFFVAEGYFYTRSKKRYILMLLMFTLISWLPYNLAMMYNWYKVNVIGVFLLSVIGMTLIDKIKETKYIFSYIAMFIIYIVLLLTLDMLSIVPEGILGVLLPISFYVSREKKFKIFPIVIMTLICFVAIGQTGNFLVDYKQIFSLVAIFLLMCYNGQKGKANLKYLFYVGYPVHLTVLWIISIL